MSRQAFGRRSDSSKPPQPSVTEPSAAIVSERSPTLDFIDGFARYERGVRDALTPFLLEGQRFTGSTLDR